MTNFNKSRKSKEHKTIYSFKNTRRLATLLLAIPLFFALFRIIEVNRNKNIRAFGDLIVDFGVPSGDPIFVFDDFKPGDCENHDIVVTNGGLNTALVAIRSDNETDTGNLSSTLFIIISENSTHLYGGTSSTGPKSLADFYTDSDNSDGIPLSSVVGSGGETTYNIEVCFPKEAGNEFQETSTVFDLIFGELLPPIDLPEECWHLNGIITEVVEGTEGHDRLHTTTASELILLYGGNDRVWASSGSDCIVAGPGNDRVEEGTGDGVVLGGPGNDRIETGTGNDTVYGGEGNDNIKTGSDNDLVYGNEGNDEIRTGSGNDTVYGGSENDVIRGGSGDDWLYGNEGNDVLRGQTGDDHLDGGPGLDVLKGSFGIDTCVFGETLSSCELP